MADLLLLEAIVALAFFVEATTGFGATVVAVALGGAVLPVRELLPAFVPVNLALSLFVVGSDPAAVDRPTLFRRVLPAMLLGFPVGAVAFRLLGERAGALEVAFGAFVVAVAALRLFGIGAVGRRTGVATLGLAGVVHGAFGTGGPLVVMTLGALGLDKRAFRATLAALWALLALFLLGSYALAGALTLESLRLSALLFPPMLVGLLLGQRVHARLDPARFRLAVDALLLVAGGVLLARTLGVM